MSNQYAYYLARTENMLVNEKPEPKINCFASVYLYTEELHKWLSNHKTVEYANEENKEKMGNLITEIYDNTLGARHTKSFKEFWDSGIVISGEGIRIEFIPKRKGVVSQQISEADFDRFVAYLDDVKEETNEDLWHEIYLSCPVSLFRHEKWIEEIKSKFTLTRK